MVENRGLYRVSVSRLFKIGASQMTTKFLTKKFAKFPNFIVMEFPRKNSVLGQFSVNFPPPRPPPKRKFYSYCRFGSFPMRKTAPFVPF